METENDPAALEALVSAGNDEGLKALALFILGGYYENMGFYPEASGYYSRLMRLRKEGYLNKAAHFRKSRLLFFEGKYEMAREGFRKSLDGGFSANAVVTSNGDAPRWLLPDPEKRKLGVSMLFENS